MSHVSRDSASQVEKLEGEFEGRYEDIGNVTVGFESYFTEADMAPLFAGLPDDACQCPHQGYVIRGQVGFRHTDGTEEIIRAGEAYVIGPGHTVVFYPGTDLVEFSPADQLQETMQVVLRNVELAGA